MAPLLKDELGVWDSRVMSKEWTVAVTSAPATQAEKNWQVQWGRMRAADAPKAQALNTVREKEGKKPAVVNFDMATATNGEHNTRTGTTYNFIWVEMYNVILHATGSEAADLVISNMEDVDRVLAEKIIM